MIYFDIFSEDDEIEEVKVLPSEFSDPAILAVKLPTPQYRYTQTELMELREAPLSTIRPECLDTAFDNADGVWDPELWHYGKKSSEGGSDNGNRPSEPENPRVS